MTAAVSRKSRDPAHIRRSRLNVASVRRSDGHPHQARRRWLSDAAIDWVIDAYTRGAVADEQMSALLMAILLRGMTRGEIARWTAAMIASGERLDFSDLRATTARPWTSTPPAGSATRSRCRWRPLVVACGAAVPQLSGRGLGHTGGTLDKLESIPGLAADAVQRPRSAHSCATSAR